MQASLRRNGIAIIVKKSLKPSTWVQSQKKPRIISVRFQGKLFNITVIHVYATNAEEAEVERFYEDLQDLLELIQKKMSFSSWEIGTQK